MRVFSGGRRDIGLLDACFAGVATVSLVAVTLLWLGVFSSRLTWLIAGVLLGIGALLYRPRLRLPEQTTARRLGLILLLAIVVRVPPYLYLPGGQDQGVYVSMSAAFEHNGTPFLTDRVRQALAPDIVARYDYLNHYDVVYGAPGRWEGTHMPGVYLRDRTRSEDVFQFYPLQPLAMSLVASVAGDSQRVYALTLFALLSIVCMYRLALDLAGGKPAAATILALLLAVSPLHAFFSKYPVTEIAALAFSSAGFAYLARYARLSADDKPAWGNLVFAAAAFTCLFFTRITGFIYMPILLVLPAAAIVGGDPRARRELLAFALMLIGGYLASLLYGYTRSFPYFTHIHDAAFRRFLGGDWPVRLAGLTLAGMGALVVLVLFSRPLGRLYRPLRARAGPLLAGLVFLVLGLAAWKAYRLGFTDAYQHAGWIHRRWGMDGQGWQSLLHSAVVVWATYCSPPIVLLLPWAVLRLAKRRDPVAPMLLLATAAFLFAGLCMFFTVPYHYYYTRYLLSEVVPVTLLVVALLLGAGWQAGRWPRLAVMLAMLMSLGWSAHHTARQFMGREAAGSEASLTQIRDHVTADGLLVAVHGSYAPFELHEILTPLRCYYDLDVMIWDTVDPALPDGIGRNYKHVIWMAPTRVNLPAAKPLGKVVMRQGAFYKSRHVPIGFRTKEKTLYLYSQERDANRREQR